MSDPREFWIWKDQQGQWQVSEIKLEVFSQKQDYKRIEIHVREIIETKDKFTTIEGI